MLVGQCVYVCTCVGGLAGPCSDYPNVPPPSGVLFSSFVFFPLLVTGARIDLKFDTLCDFIIWFDDMIWSKNTYIIHAFGWLCMRALQKEIPSEATLLCSTRIWRANQSWVLLIHQVRSTGYPMLATALKPLPFEAWRLPKTVQPWQLGWVGGTRPWPPLDILNGWKHILTYDFYNFYLAGYIYPKHDVILHSQNTDMPASTWSCGLQWQQRGTWWTQWFKFAICWGVMFYGKKWSFYCKKTVVLRQKTVVLRCVYGLSTVGLGSTNFEFPVVWHPKYFENRSNKLLVCLPCVHGLSMVCPWFVYGLAMVLPWNLM